MNINTINIKNKQLKLSIKKQLPTKEIKYDFNP